MRFSVLLLLPFIRLACSGRLSFDDIPVPNEGNCGRHTFVAAHHGFAISGGAVVNTTQTPACHESSSGAGPWRKAASAPNLLSRAESVISFEAQRKFDAMQLACASTLHWTVRATDENAVVRFTVTGARKIDGPVVVKKTVDVKSDGPHVVALPGFSALRRVSVGAQLRYVENGALVVLEAPFYVDDFVYNFVYNVL